MVRPASRHPTELELEILKVLWREGPCPARAVWEALAAVRKLACTSVITVMNIMVEKGYLARRKRRGSFVYRPRVGQDATAGRMLGDLVERVFDGSASAAMLNLLETGRLDEQEIRRMKELLDEHSGAGESSGPARPRKEDRS